LGTGFKFYGYSADNFFDCLLRGLDLFSDTDQWLTLVRRAMKQDFSVHHMAKEYIALYRKMLDTKKP
jgi:starch synthase